MSSSDGEGLSQLYLELVDAYKKMFLSQNKHYLSLSSSPSPKLGNRKQWLTRPSLKVVR